MLPAVLPPIGPTGDWLRVIETLAVS